MIKLDKHIEIVSSSRTWLSSMSHVSREAIHTTLSKRYSDVRITLIDSFLDLEALVARKPDLVFLGIKYIPFSTDFEASKNGQIWLADYLDEHDIAYTGSSRIAHERELNKPIAKQCVIDAGLQTSPFCVFKQDQTVIGDYSKLKYPLFVKPVNLGGGEGVDSNSVVRNPAQLHAKIASIASLLKSDSLVEEYLPGREFSVAVIKDEYSDALLAMPIELVAPTNEYGASFLGGQMKTSNMEKILEVTDEYIKTKVSNLALNVFQALGAKNYGRIDIRLNASGIAQFLEANLIPSLIDGYGSFPKACKLNIDLDYEDMIFRIVDLGFSQDSDISLVDETTISLQGEEVLAEDLVFGAI